MNTCKIEALLESIEAELWEDVEGASVRLEAVKDCLYALTYGMGALKEQLQPAQFEPVGEDVIYYKQIEKIRKKLVDSGLIDV